MSLPLGLLPIAVLDVIPALRRLNCARQSALLGVMAVAVERQLPLIPFLEALGDDVGGAWRWRVRTLSPMMRSGTSLADALEAIPGIVPPDVVMAIRVGSESGYLAETLQETSARLAKRCEATSKGVGGTLFYLWTVGGVLASIFGFIMVWIVPKFKAIFEGFGVELPPLTIRLIEFCDFVGAYWYLFLFALAIPFWIALMGMAELLIPGAGAGGLFFLPSRWFRGRRVPHVLRNLAIAVDAGRLLEDVLRDMSTRYPDTHLRFRLAPVAQAVAGGSNCWDVLCGAGMIGRRDAALLQSSQRAGNLAWALRGTADDIERRASYRMAAAVELLEPVMLLAAGGVVGTFVVGMFLPLVQLLAQIQYEP
jgi:type II secretory pathway component PulF